MTANHTDEMESNLKKLTIDKQCVKCPKAGLYFSADPRKAVYCEECFVKMIKHKFAYALGTNRIYKDGKSKATVVIYTGDANSALLLSLIKHGMSQEKNRRLQMEPRIVVIYDELNKKAFLERHQKVLEIRKLLAIDAPWHFVHIAAVIDPDFKLTFFNDPRFEYSEKEIDGFHQVPKYAEIFGANVFFSKSDKVPLKNSEKMELQRLLFDILLWKIAQQCQVDKVMLPENIESLANKSFNVVAFGRGNAMAELTSVLDKRHPSVSLIRPMREIYDSEVHFLNELEGSNQYSAEKSKRSPNTVKLAELKQQYKPKFQTHKPQGIQDLTQNFLSSLQEGGFPGTMTTILSVAQKVEPAKSDSEASPRCKVCLIRFNPNELSPLMRPNCCLPCNKILPISNYEFVNLVLRVVGDLCS